MYSRPICPEAGGEANTPSMPLLRSLAGLPGVLVAINMALLTELGQLPARKLCIKCKEDSCTPRRFAFSGA